MSSVLENFKYHVFLSFRGKDTRKTFVDHLYTSLTRLGIHTFRDNEELEKGKRIGELFKAIEESRFLIIVFSKNYASSSWCLKELAKIMECQDGSKRIAYPLFYDVEPRDVRRQSGPVGIAIAKHKADKQIIKTWKKALQDAGNLVGWEIKKIANGHEAEAIDQIVKEISVKLRAVHLTKDENLVGMESRMQDLEASLGKGLENEVRMIGIKGMGGIGKTTLARAIFQEISSQFEGKSFVENVREASKAKGLLSLQQQVLKDVLGADNVNSVQDAISLMKDRMPLKKVLLVIDDVDHKDQLEALAGALYWFKGGSRIIITTRNKQVLKAHRVVLKKLRFLDLVSSNLRTLDLGMTPNLERLNLRGCRDLTEIHAPSGCLERLVAVNLRGCSSFRSSSFIQQLESPELLSLPKLEVTGDFLRNSPSNHLPKLEITCFYLEEQASSEKDNHKFVCLDLHLESFSGSFFGLRHRRHLRLVGCIPDLPNDLDELTNLEELLLMETHIKWLPDSICMLKHLKTLKLESFQLLQELPKDLGRLVCLEKLILNSTSIQCLPDSISLLKHLRSLELIYCQFLEELPWDLGQLEWLEKLILIGCKSLKHIPNNICNMKCLEVLNIYYTGIRHLSQSISSLEGLQIVGSEAVLRSCDFATEIQTSDDNLTFCYIQATDNKEAKTKLDNQFMKNFCYMYFVRFPYMQ
ncbi:hypothetical protein LXL04_010589 [Taraxacum kok-saghyz]